VAGVSGATHWEDTYSARAREELGWYEPRPSTLDLVLRYSEPSDSVVDVGAGDSGMADELIRASYEDITLVDLSATALERVRSRLSMDAGRVEFVQTDVTTWAPTRQWELWHDRAVFHFLVDAGDREAYKRVALRSLSATGHLVVATFAPDGPEQCAGLPVRRYDSEALAAEFAPELQVVEQCDLRGAPGQAGDQRPYIAVVLRRG
jgi:trans-aconitate methyltransferase